MIERLRPIVTCVTEQPIGAASVQTGRASISFMPFGRPVRLRRVDRASHVNLEFRLDHTIDGAKGGFAASLAGYAFSVLEPDGREILVFHWHPDGASAVKHPHVHLTSRIPPILLGRSGAVLSLANAHVPTGLISLSDVVRFLIEEVEVEPRRADWQSILDAERSPPGTV